MSGAWQDTSSGKTWVPDPPTPVEALAIRIGSRICLETLYSHATAFALSERWAQLAADRGWSDEDTERVAMTCAMLGIHPDTIAGALDVKPLGHFGIVARDAEYGAAWRRLGRELLDATGIPRLVDWLAQRVRL